MISHGPISSAPISSADVGDGRTAIGGAEYQVGTHQSAYAAENRSWVHGTVALLIVVAAATVTPKTVVAAPEHVDSGSAWIVGQQPASASAVANMLRQARPQDVDDARATRSRYVYPFIAAADTKPPSMLVASPEQFSSGDAKLWHYPTFAALDIPPARTAVAAPEHINSGSSTLAKYVYPSVFGTDVLGAANYSVGTHGADYAQSNGYAVRTGKFSQPAAPGADVRIGQTEVAAPEQVNSGDAWLFGPTPPSASAVPVTLKFARPQDFDYGAAHVFGTIDDTFVAIVRYYEIEQDSPEQPPPLVFGFTPTAAPATKIAGTIVEAPEQLDFASATTWQATPQQIPPYVPARFVIGPEQDAGNPTQPSTWGLFQPFTAGTDVRIGTFVFASEPFYPAVEYGFTFTINADLIPPPAPPVDTGPALGPWGPGPGDDSPARPVRSMFDASTPRKRKKALPEVEIPPPVAEAPLPRPAPLPEPEPFTTPLADLVNLETRLALTAAQVERAAKRKRDEDEADQVVALLAAWLMMHD